MTIVRIWDDEKSAGISMHGHAGYDHTGRDVVCAACSVLAQSLVNTLCVLGVKTSWRQSPGEMDVGFEKSNGAEGERAMGAFQMARVGLEMLATSYPGNVTITD